jgi:hypothetical protein
MKRKITLQRKNVPQLIVYIKFIWVKFVVLCCSKFFTVPSDHLLQHALNCCESDRVVRLLSPAVMARKADMKKEVCVGLILFCQMEVFGFSFDYGLILNLVI